MGRHQRILAVDRGGKVHTCTIKGFDVLDLKLCLVDINTNKDPSCFPMLRPLQRDRVRCVTIHDHDDEAHGFR